MFDTAQELKKDTRNKSGKLSFFAADRIKPCKNQLLTNVTPHNGLQVLSEARTHSCNDNSSAGNKWRG